MENNETNNPEATPDPTVSHGDKAPADPSNTSHIGQRVEQGVLSKKDGITEQSTEWENEANKDAAGESLINPEADRYIKNPSPEENDV